MIRRPPRSTPLYSSAASDVYKRQGIGIDDGATQLVIYLPVILRLKAVFMGLIQVGIGKSERVKINFIAQIDIKGGEFEAIAGDDMIQAEVHGLGFCRLDKAIEAATKQKETIDIRRLECLVVIGKQAGLAIESVVHADIPGIEPVSYTHL